MSQKNILNTQDEKQDTCMQSLLGELIKITVPTFILLSLIKK